MNGSCQYRGGKWTSHLAGMVGGCASLLARGLDTACTSSMREGEKRSARRIAGVERLAGRMMVLFRVIDRKCVISTGSTGEVEESVQLPHPSMTEGSVCARGVEEWGVVLHR